MAMKKNSLPPELINDLRLLGKALHQAVVPAEKEKVVKFLADCIKNETLATTKKIDRSLEINQAVLTNKRELVELGIYSEVINLVLDLTRCTRFIRNFAAAMKFFKQPQTVPAMTIDLVRQLAVVNDVAYLNENMLRLSKAQLLVADTNPKLIALQSNVKAAHGIMVGFGAHADIKSEGYRPGLFQQESAFKQLVALFKRANQYLEAETKNGFTPKV